MAFPTVVSVAHSNSTGTTLTMTMPSGLVAGNLLVAIAACTGNESGPTIGGGFTQVGTLGASNGTLWVSVKIATGSDGSATLTTGFANSKAGSVYQVQDWGGVLADIKAAFVGTTLDVPSLSMPLGADDYLWIAVGKSNGDLTGAPTNYTNYVESTVTGLQLGTARRTLNASSENPGAFAGTSTNPMSALIGITPPEVFGDIVYEGNGAIAASATNPAVAYPSGIAAGDLLVLVVGQKPATANGGGITDPSGWGSPVAAITGAGGYGATLGADTGNTNLWCYVKEATGSESGSLTVTMSDTNVTWGWMHRLSSVVADEWDVAGTTGSDTTAGSVSVTFGADPGVQSEDYVLAAMCIPTDVTTPNQFSAQALTQTGVTFGTVRGLGEPDSSLGNDIGGFMCRARVLSGTGSAAPVMTATASGTTTNVRGPAAFVRVRRVASGGPPPATGNFFSFFA